MSAGSYPQAIDRRDSLAQVDPPLPELVDATRRLLREDRRVVLGITGPPGAGKTTLAEALVAALLSEPGSPGHTEAALVPMDGFHLADAQLSRLGLTGRKGAPETFDVDGYVETLRRLRRPGALVYVPGFERDLEQPLAAARVVLPQARVVVTEGNYLLSRRGGWRQVRPLLDQVWYVEAPDDLRQQRLEARHVEFGKDPEAARTWVDRVDEPNAVLVAADRRLADRVVTL